MKEAAGEANMTVVTIVLIGIVLGVGTLIVNNLMKNTSQKAACSEAGGIWYQNKCQKGCTSTDVAGQYSCSGPCEYYQSTKTYSCN